MSGSDDDECVCPPSLPAYLATFADLMSLLMCFFVLLLSFSEMDVQKYKQVAGSMAEAFGVQDTINTKDIPKGTSIIAQEFSPGRPDPTPVNEVRQSTTDVTQAELDLQCQQGKTATENANDKSSENTSENTSENSSTAEADAKLGVPEMEAEKTAMSLANELTVEISHGQVEVETDGAKIVIRLKEQNTFKSGSSEMEPEFIPIMMRIRDVLKGVRGVYTIEGYTDDIPISSARYRSNWELSTSRAVSVLQELLEGGYLDERRFSIVGYGSVRPIVPNTSPENRAKNRRVEIIVEQGKDPDWKEFKIFDSEEVDKVIQEIKDKEKPAEFKFDQDEIF